MSPSPAERQRAEAVIKTFWYVLALSVIALCWEGCSSSGSASNGSETSVNDTNSNDLSSTETNANSNATKHRKPKSQRFTVQADTLTAQSRKKEGSGNSPVSMRSTGQTKYYSVQVGGFKLQSNIDNNKKILSQRFKLPLVVFFDKAITMTRICVGNFSTKKAALKFLSTMKEKYPNDYAQAWVAELKK
ncbi:MAG: SPOR domain-containing protein [Bacteroidota bacterium]|nr:SPOR domain-containing protein [Bacteroidota bacterium]